MLQRKNRLCGKINKYSYEIEVIEAVRDKYIFGKKMLPIENILTYQEISLGLSNYESSLRGFLGEAMLGYKNLLSTICIPATV